MPRSETVDARRRQFAATVVAGSVALDDGCLTASAALTAGNVRCTQCDAEAVAVTASG